MDKFIDMFKKGTQFVNIVSAVSSEELTFSDHISTAYTSEECIKFIPASGAATRMFKNLYEFLDNQVETDFVNVFFDNLEKFAFYKLLDLSGLDKNRLEDRVQIVDKVLNTDLNYGQLPKALIKMHTYESVATTPIDEHIYEGESYLDSESVNLHFTISKEHEALFNAYVENALKDKQDIDITYSFQKKETDTLAVDMNNAPFVLENGQVLYRAGGHGALIENLNDLNGDIIFIKNIDNVCHKDHSKETIDSKKMLASIGLEVKAQVDGHIKSILENDFDLAQIQAFINSVLNIRFKNELTKEKALEILDRPLRVCGVVKNQGEPGGGPFIVDNGDYFDLQICEKAEIDLENPEHLEILNASKYFNPVDLVCFVRNHRGEKFNLLDYINKDRYFISEKTYKGRKLKALEHPGLWNGAMHHWNTLFVEVPLSTFNPVKTVNDLLRQGHRAKV